MRETFAESIERRKRTPKPPRVKASHVGAPAIFQLELCCQQLNRAFSEGYGCYLVGSSLKRPDWRDVDVRMILSDESFDKLFPSSKSKHCLWEFDPRWIIMTTSISAWLSKQTGLPIDFQFQPQTHANARHRGPRHALGMRFVPSEDDDA